MKKRSKFYSPTKVGLFRSCILAKARFSLLACLTFVLLQGCGPTKDEQPADEMVLHGTTSRIRGFDPVKAGDVASSLVISKVYEGLLQYSYLERPYKVEPLLAESLPEISADGLTYTFKLRKGIYFQDDPCFPGGKGRELVAEDFVYSIKRVADMNNHATGYWAYNDRIVGLDEFRKSTDGGKVADYDARVEGLLAIDDHTFQMTLKRPYPQLLWILTMHYAFAIPREAVECYGHEFINHPVGTGPFAVDSWIRNYRIEFVRNPKWAETGRRELFPSDGSEEDGKIGLQEDAGKKLPFLDRIVLYVISDASTQWLKFVSGGLESSGISRDNWDAVMNQKMDLDDSLSRRGVRLYKTPSLDVFYIGFNMSDPVVGSPAGERSKKLRQALTCAFDSEKWISFWNHRAIRAKGPIPPGVAGYDDEPSPYPFDLKKARVLLAEAGYPGGVDKGTGKRLRLKIEIGRADPQSRDAVELVAAFLMEIGIILEPNYNNWPTFLQKMERRQCQLYRLGWIADYPDAENFLQLFYGPNSSPGPKHSIYENKEFDELYKKIRTMQDGPDRTKIYRQMSNIVIEDCPWIFTDHPMSYGLHHSWVRNYKPHDFPYGMLKYRKIDDSVRSEWKSAYGKKHWRD
jgi:oligopeptide transport system substrate-binding protein